MAVPFLVFIIILSSIFLFSSLVVAGGQFKGKNKTQPPGWEQGKKTGWKGEETPPGLNEEKVEKKQKARMKGDEAKDKAQEEGEKAIEETELKEEKAEQEAALEQKKKKQEAEIKKEKEKMKSKRLQFLAIIPEVRSSSAFQARAARGPDF